MLNKYIFFAFVNCGKVILVFGFGVEIIILFARIGGPTKINIIVCFNFIYCKDYNTIIISVFRKHVNVKVLKRDYQIFLNTWISCKPVDFQGSVQSILFLLLFFVTSQ